MTSHEQVTAQKCPATTLLGEKADDVFFLSGLDGIAIIAEVILDALESNLLTELEARKAT